MLALRSTPARLVAGALGLAASTFLASPDPANAQDKSVTIVLLEELANFDLCNSMLSTTGRVLRQNVGETLTKIDPNDGSVTPLLATSWEQVDDKTWRFNLREGVTFHDGTPFTADAVVKSVERTFHTEALTCENRTKSGLNHNIFAEAVDDLTVDVRLDMPAPILPVRMGTMTISHPDAPMEVLQTDKPLGTGPYVFSDFNTGVDITLTRYEDYWGEMPEVESARYVFRKESSVRAAMVEIGEADIAPNIAAQDATNPKTDYSFLNSESTRLKIDSAIPPLDDKRVRMALNLAIDREALRGSVFSNEVLFSTQLVVPSIAGHNHEIDKRLWPYDPDKAMALIAEARADGVPVDTEISLACRVGQWPGAEEGMEAIHAFLTVVGFNIDLKCLEQNLHYQLTNKPYVEDRGPQLLQDQHDNNNGDPVFTVHGKYGCEGVQSTTCNDTVDALTAKATALPIGEERINTWQEIFRILYEDQIADVPLFHMVGYSRVGPRIAYTPSIATNTEVELAKITFK